MIVTENSRVPRRMTFFREKVKENAKIGGVNRRVLGHLVNPLFWRFPPLFTENAILVNALLEKMSCVGWCASPICRGKRRDTVDQF